MPGFRILTTDWARDRERLSDVRRVVFIDEQGVPDALEWDGDDAGAVHFLALDDQEQAIGCARLLPDGHIGRMAVLPGRRGRGVGQALLQAVFATARQNGQRDVKLSAQTHAAGFYARHGFVAEGPIYPEAGIPHIAMHRSLA